MARGSLCSHTPPPPAQIKDGASVYEICSFGDTVVNQACAGIYQKKVKGEAVEKGVAFPTCVCARARCPANKPTPRTRCF
jgi:hypothetical protein